MLRRVAVLTARPVLACGSMFEIQPDHPVSENDIFQVYTVFFAVSALYSCLDVHIQTLLVVLFQSVSYFAHI